MTAGRGSPTPDPSGAPLNRRARCGVGPLPPDGSHATADEPLELGEEDQVRFFLRIRQGSASARVIRRAHTLLQAREGAFDHQRAVHPAAPRRGPAGGSAVRAAPFGRHADARRQGRSLPRLGSRGEVAREVGAWEQERNAAVATVTWRFTTAHVRTRLARLFPQIVG